MGLNPKNEFLWLLQRHQLMKFETVWPNMEQSAGGASWNVMQWKPSKVKAQHMVSLYLDLYIL